MNEQAEVPCQSCNGDGWTVTYVYSGYPEQEMCESCNGTGGWLADKDFAKQLLGGTGDE